MTKAWEWIKAKALWLAGAIGGLLLVVLGSGWLWKRRKGRVPSAHEIEAAGYRLQRLNEIQAALKARVGEKDAAIAQIDAEKIEFQRTIVAAQQDVEELSDSEVVAEFRRLYPPRS